jgi:hypothetical protein
MNSSIQDREDRRSAHMLANVASFRKAPSGLRGVSKHREI